jgi:DNA-directed RNA polymerase specialized sigma24 family protein
MDEQLSTLAWRLPAVRFRSRMTRIVGPWHRNRRWTPEEAAGELHRRRDELIAQLRRRGEARGIPPGAQEEIVDDAITAVVMSPRGVVNEHHLLGAFWLAVDHRCRRHREGRHLTRLGSRRRVGFDLATQQAPVADNPFDALELRDRFARAADLMADLNAREREVVCVIASRGVGPVSAARLLGLSLGEVRSAARSANAKLDRIAAIYAAGRMCQFRAGAIAADAAGNASERDVRLARAHVSACVPCGRVYRRLRREMRSRDFQRAAAAAFLPMPAMSNGHIGGIDKFVIWIEERINFMPRGSGGRAAEVIGGAGIAKAAAAGTAVVAAGGALTGPIVHSLDGSGASAHHRAHIARHTRQPVTGVSATSSLTPRSSAASTEPSRTRATAHRSAPPPPSKSLEYLALGKGGPALAKGSTSHESVSRNRSARTASVTSSSAMSESGAPATTGAVSPAQSGGGTALGYLGR